MVDVDDSSTVTEQELLSFAWDQYLDWTWHVATADHDDDGLLNLQELVAAFGCESLLASYDAVNADQLQQAPSRLRASGH